MARRVVLDTGVVAGLERGRRPFPVEPGDDVVIAAITVAELRAGIELGDPERRTMRSAALTRLLEFVPVIPYDAAVAQAHASLLIHVRRTGRPWGAHDLIVAATAAATGRVLLTTDRQARFDDLPGVELLTPDRTHR